MLTEAKDKKAVVVEEVVEGGNADQSGQVQVGDIVTKYAPFHACIEHDAKEHLIVSQHRDGLYRQSDHDSVLVPTGAAQQF